MTGGTDSRWTLQAGAGGAVRVGLGGVFRLQLGGLRLLGRLTGGSGEHFTGAAKTYRRMETTGDVDEHVLDVAYELSLGIGHETPDTWWLERPGDLVAQIVVPHEHAPATPVPEEQALAAGTLRRAMRAWPAGVEMLDLSSGAFGLYPS
ncbi:hypothetical protein NGM37_43855, partial [Streptomyces sp. TRM76130]|nr:hypothetical protein [Streptomyces sp. TRM76130]